MRIVLLGLVLAACGGKSDSLCQQAVGHVFELTMVGPKPKSDEARVIDMVKDAALSRCKSEGLSRAQADCILAAHYPDWDDQLRACPAFAAKPASWVTVRPPRDQRRAMRDRPPIPDGPREDKIHYRQLVARPEATCGLTEAGQVQCWGEPLEAAFPAGTFVQIASSGPISCGREASGTLRCAYADPPSTDPTPTDALGDFALDHWGGCGVRASDKQITCWSIYDSIPVSAPLGQYTTVVVNHTGGCARTVEGATQCFGESPPSLPPADVLSYSSDEASCTVSKDHHLTCTNAYRLGPPPTGTFDAVATSRGHACATRSGGGTVCWGENDGGECNVPP
jgi:hypothetical protein